MEDEEYMKQLSYGNDSAFDPLVFRYHKSLYGYVYRLTLDEKLAEDIVQETFIKIYNEGKKGHVPDMFKPWIYKIATNLCKDYWKKGSTQKEKLTDVIIDKNVPIQNIINLQMERKWMLEALSKLKIEYRTVLYLRFYQDLKYSEIALALDLSINTVKSRITRGLKHLEVILKLDARKGVEGNE